MTEPSATAAALVRRRCYVPFCCCKRGGLTPAEARLVIASIHELNRRVRRTLERQS